MAKIIHTETVSNATKKAHWPYEGSYTTTMTRVKLEKSGYIFNGWKYNGRIYKEPFDNESTNPFGPLSRDTSIFATWTKIGIFCIPNKTIVSADGEDVEITYYVQIGDNVITDGVTFAVDTQATTAGYTIISDRIVNGKHVCTVRISENTTPGARTLVVYSQYNGASSEKANILQSGQREIIIPDCDYFHFVYSWENGDNGGGTDLDSLTVVYVQDEQGHFVEKSFTGKAVGYGANERVCSMKDGEIDKVFLEHGGDCRTSGAENAIICLTNMAETDEIHGTENILVKIYANWFISKGGGNMVMHCYAYKSTNPDGPNYGKDINIVPHQDEISSYNTFTPNTAYCRKVWEDEISLHINAFDRPNATNANRHIECAGEIYSDVCTILYRVSDNYKGLIPRTEDNGIDNATVRLNVKSDLGIELRFNYDPTDTETHQVTGIYIQYNNENYELFSHEDDSIFVIVNGYPMLTIKTEDIGNAYGLDETGVFTNFLVKQRNNKTDIEFNLDRLYGTWRQVILQYSKYFDDCTPPIERGWLMQINQSN